MASSVLWVTVAWPLSMKRIALLIVAAFLAGCALPATTSPRRVVRDHVGTSEGFDLTPGFKAALSEMARLDATDGWTPATCESVAATFKQLNSRMGKTWLAAIYNAGVAYQRCGDLDNASAQFEHALQADPKAHRARVQLVRIKMHRGQIGVDDAVKELERAIKDADYQNEEALVDLARLQVQRGDTVANEDGESDFARASKNLRRALALDDGDVPAYNQLALLYLQRARRDGGRVRDDAVRGVAQRRMGSRELDLAFLVASQAAQRAPRGATIKNTLGILAVESGDLSHAAKAFGEARVLEPSFFEAHMNYASVNLMFRGFARAEEAYRAAIDLRPQDYDAHLGLALALRGQIDLAVDGDAKLGESERLLEKAKQLDAARPEAYFNHAILIESYKAKGVVDAGASLRTAIALYEEFVKRAAGKAQFAAAVDDVTAVPAKDCDGQGVVAESLCKRGRIHDLRDIISFNEEASK